MKTIITILALSVLTLSCRKKTDKEITYSVNNTQDVKFSWRTESNANTLNRKKLYVESNSVIMYYYQSDDNNTHTVELNIYVDGVPHKRNPIIESFNSYGGGEVYID